MRLQGVIPNSVIYNALLSACEKGNAAISACEEESIARELLD